MKKLLFLISAPILFLCSCSSDSTSEPEFTTEGTLLRRTIYHDFFYDYTTDYNYNGNKIINEVSSLGNRYEYTYTGDLITKREFYVLNVLRQREFFQYDSQQRITEILALLYTPDGDGGSRTEYIYNPDHTVNIKYYSGDLTTQNTLENESLAFLTPNGEIDKLERYISGYLYTDVYHYDTQNNTSNPVVGLNQLKYWNVDGSTHNLIRVDQSTTQAPGSISSENFYFTYNSFGYPGTKSNSGRTTDYLYQLP